LGSVLHEVGEEALLALGGFGDILGVPLHADHAVTRAVFPRFDDDVRGSRNDDKISCEIL